jgi:hypothetical protein
MSPRVGGQARMAVRALGVLVLLLTASAVGIGLMDTGWRRPMSTTPAARAFADRQFAAEARKIDRASVGETHVARFLGLAFGMSEKAIAAQHEDLGASWGDLTIAHTFAASDEQGMTVAQVLQLHDRGMGWGQVAAGLRFKLSDAARAVGAESRIARGRAEPDGTMASIDGDGF